MFVRHPIGWVRPGRRRLSLVALERLRRRACLEIITHFPPGSALYRAVDRHQLTQPGTACETRISVTPDASHYLLAHRSYSLVFSFEDVELRHAPVEKRAFHFLERSHRSEAAD